MALTKWQQQPYTVWFWSKVEKTDGCWEWRGYRSPKGYGEYRDATGKRTTAHRISWQLAGHDIPEGLTLDHLCRNRGCVNPDHLEPVTNRENVMRGVRTLKPCPPDHVRVERRDGASTYTRCLTCKRERDRLRSATHRPELWR